MVMVSVFQKHWHIVGDSVKEAALEFLNSVLIPKAFPACYVTDYKLISTLCNVLYKIVAKVLANRLKK
jgi:hypothetical protein